MAPVSETAKQSRGGKLSLWPRSIITLAAGFWLVMVLVQAWRLFSLSATYDQALFLQELWSTSQGRPFESSLSSVLSGDVALGGALPWVTYLHLGQHANAFTLLGAPLVGVFGAWALPLIQVSALTAAGLVLWRIADDRLPRSLAVQISLAYFLSGAVVGPAMENFHDLIWLPLLGFLVVAALLDGCLWRVLLFSALLLLVREDSGLLLFSIGLWALLRQPKVRLLGALLMVGSFGWVLMVTGWIQPMVDSSLADRFLQEKFGHLVEDVSEGSLAVVLGMLSQPLALLQSLITPPGATLGFLLALTLPLVFVPFRSLDAALLVAVPLLIALVSQGRTALAVTLRYVLALVPGLYLGTVLWWADHPRIWPRRWLRRIWTASLVLGLMITVVGNPHRSLSAVIPDSISPWVHVPAEQMLARRKAAIAALEQIPPQASVSADTPLLPLLAQREALIRFPKHTRFRDREGLEQEVDWVAAFPGFYTPLAPVFKRERKQQSSIQEKLDDLVKADRFRPVHCQSGVVLLRRVDDTTSDPMPTCGNASPCPWLPSAAAAASLERSPNPDRLGAKAARSMERPQDPVRRPVLGSRSMASG